MSTLKKILQSKIVKNLFWLAFWGGNLLTVAILIFSNITSYIYPIGHKAGQVPSPPIPEFLDRLVWGGYMFIVNFSWIILSVNLLFLAYLMILKKQKKKIPHTFITIIMSIIIASILTYGMVDLYLRLYF